MSQQCTRHFLSQSCYPTVLDCICQETGSGTLGVNMFRQPWSPVGCDYRAEVQRHTWAGSQAGGCVVGEVRQDAQQQAPRAAADPSVFGLNKIYKPPHEDRQQCALLQHIQFVCLTLGAPRGMKPVVSGINESMEMGVRSTDFDV